MRRLSALRRPRLAIVLAVVVLVIGTVLGGLAWLAASESGLHTLTRLLVDASGGRLTLEQAGGRLLGPLRIDRLRWQTPELQVELHGLRLDWRPAALLAGRLHIDTLGLDRLAVDSPSSDTASPPPTDLRLPLAVEITYLTLGQLQTSGQTLATNITARLDSDGRQHRISALSLVLGPLGESPASTADSDGRVAATLHGDASLDGQAPFPLRARIDAATSLAGRQQAFDATLSGTLTRIAVALHARQGLSGQAQATLQPFAAQPLAAAAALLDDLDPSLWLATAPRARLRIEAHLEQAPESNAQQSPAAAGLSGLAGRLDMLNRQPGPLDQGRLPLASASLRLVAAGGKTLVQDIALVLPGGGSVRGDGEWNDDTLHLRLAVRRLDAARLTSTLRTTRFDGPLTLALGRARQSASLAWRDAAIAVDADLEHAGTTLTLARLRLASGAAQLAANGHVDTDGQRAFSASARLERFDPSRFARVPAASINARIDADGRLTPRPTLAARFALDASRYADQPLAGSGRLKVAWPHFSDVDIQLSAGANTLIARGDFGRAQDRLRLDIDAPRLAPFGIDGALRGTAELGGTPQKPSLALDVDIPRLAYPDVGRIESMQLRTRFSPEADAPLLIEADIGSAARQSGETALKQTHLRIQGSQREHSIRLATGLAAAQQLRQFELSASGGWSGPLDASGLWRGRLDALRLAEADGSERLALRQPAALTIGASTGWSLGPAALAGNSPAWRASLQASADAARLHLSLAAESPTFGRLDGQLDAGMSSPWRIADTAPWQGRLRLDATELAWLGELLGEGWQTGGRLSADLQLEGTPARPLSRGHLDGKDLLVRQNEQGLHLSDGELAADFAGDRLRIERLRFASQLSEPPRTLRQALATSARGAGSGSDALARFASPGQVLATGEVLLGNLTGEGGSGSESAFFDIQLDRLGVWQLADQWVAISGKGRLSWRENTLGARGDLAVDAGYWQLAPSGMPRLSDDVVIKRGAAAAPSGTRLNLDIDVRAALGRSFLFRGAGLQTWLAGDLRLLARGRDLPRASGNIRLRDGRFDAYGQQLAIERGVLSFDGLLDDPALDVRAVRKGLAVEAGVHVGGSARRPQVQLVSDPELPDAEKLSWLLLGRGPESVGSGDAMLLASAASSLLGNDSGGVLQQIRQTFGIDEFGVRQGTLGSDSGLAPSSHIVGSSFDNSSSTSEQILSVGKHLSDNATLGYEQSLTRAESVIKLTFNLTRRLAIVGRAGSDNALDIVYSLSFGQPPSRRTTRQADSEDGGKTNQGNGGSSSAVEAKTKP